jgi:hypothetical protein
MFEVFDHGKAVSLGKVERVTTVVDPGRLMHDEAHGSVLQEADLGVTDVGLRFRVQMAPYKWGVAGKDKEGGDLEMFAFP